MIRLLLLPFLLLVSGSVWCGETVARVIFAAGEVQVLRDGQWLPLARNAEVQAGDEVRTGATSSVQLRFTDSSIVALNSGSNFRVDEFIYKNGAAGEKALFSLLKGGLRTITGAVGRKNRQDYGIVTPTSTIGIRGTHFSLAVCADNCRNPDGSLAANGTYGGVVAGRISTTPNANPAAAREFGRGEYFFAPSASLPSQPLLTPPAFLTSRLDAQQRNAAPVTAAASNTAAAASVAAAPTPADATATTAAVTSITVTTLPAVATETLNSSGTSAVISTVTGFIAQYFNGANYVTVDSCGGTMCQPGQASEFTNSGIVLTGYSTGLTPPKGSLAGGTVVDSGSVVLNGAVYAWGRWTGAFLVTDTSGTTYSNLPSGVLFGMTDDVTVGANAGSTWPGSGLVTYALAGGPSPVDTAGNVGTLNSMSGSLDFLTRNVTFNASMTMNIPTQGTANLSMSGGGTVSPTNDNLLGATLSTSCSGTGCAAPTSGGNFDARFAGTAAQVMVVNGVGQNAVRDASGTGSQSVLFLGVLRCTSGC